MQRRDLFWGILGAIVLRAIMIGLRATSVARFSWVLYVFAVILVATGETIWVRLPDPETGRLTWFMTPSSWRSY